MTKLLNLDKIEDNTAKRLITLEGVTYPVPDMTVDNFVTTTLEAERLVASNAGMAEQVKSQIAMIMRSIPGVPEDVLAKHPLTTLSKIGAFARGEDVEGQESDDPAPAGAEGQEAGKP